MIRQEYSPVDQPPAGIDFKWLPSQRDWVLPVQIIGQFASSAQTASRQVHLQWFSREAQKVRDVAMNQTQALSITRQYNWSADMGGNGDTSASIDNTMTDILPRLWLPPGWYIQSATTALQTNDQWSNIVVVYLLSDVQPYGRMHWESLEIEAGEGG